jgi:hypothetical protein
MNGGRLPDEICSVVTVEILEQDRHHLSHIHAVLAHQKPNRGRSKPQLRTSAHSSITSQSFSDAKSYFVNTSLLIRHG